MKYRLKKKNKSITLAFILIVILVSLALTLPIPSLSRYKTDKDANATSEIAIWSFKLNENTTLDSSINLIDTLDSRYTYIIPGSSGVIPIDIDATGSEVSIKYTLSFSDFNVPNNLHIYLDNTKTTEITSSSEISATFSIADEKKDSYSLYWEWEYLTDDESNTNDNLWQDKTISINMSIKANQVIEGDTL